MELISREEAIKALEEVTCDVCEHRSTWCALCDKAEVLTRIHSLPAIEERKEGRWIKVKSSRGGYECSKCHNYAPSYQSRGEHLSNYCPNCGSRMKGE